VPTSVMPRGAEHWFWIDRIGIVLFDATLSATLFFSLVLLAMLACRQPARRIVIARVALLASLAIIPLIGMEPLPRLDVVDILLESEVLPRSLLISLAPGEPAVSPGGIPGIPLPVRSISEALLPPSPATLRWFERGLVLVYLCGVGAGLAWLLLGFGGVHWLIRCSREPSPATRRIYDQIVAGGPCAATCPALRVSGRVQHPVVVGFLRPTILIPESLDLPSDDQESLRLSFLHELAHIARSDHWFGTVASLAQTVWLLVPHTWWLRSQLLIDQEFLADGSAAGRYGTSSDYASSLLSIASRPAPQLLEVASGSAPRLAPPGKIGVPSALFLRMLMLLHCPFPIEARTPRLWSWTLRLAIVGASVLAACLVFRWPNAGAVESRQKPGPFPIPPRFHVAHFIAEPVPSSPGGRSIAYVMPVPLPKTFDLDVEVYASPTDLAQIRIAGHALRSGGPVAANPSPTPAPRSPDSSSWHRIRVRRDHQSVSIQIDGRSVSDEPSPEPTSEWLTIEPGPRSAAEFRELTVSW
jgi:beta-lactamase regulating signal transducer with metallopeptidase domain